ncbi:MAG: M23 family metallopeptidase [Patescibacteria group bacterium]|nr:M23 family metallopeptidase [Patescibacteria group bacterium]
MNKKILSILSISALIIMAVLFYYLSRQNTADLAVTNTNQELTNNSAAPQNVKKNEPVYEPLSYALSRVTKKPFAINVSPQRSPVSPEKFSGFHTGVDFEAQINEQDSEVSIYAICTGVLAQKKYASGYGGVMVQRCKINGEDVTVIYGHLRLNSITAKVGDNIEGNKKIGVLGKGYSAETDGERKHLHLGIHQGTTINILGYVKDQSQLRDWIDVATLLR